jgi:glycerol-3-phosphate cytidylyltransferase
MIVGYVPGVFDLFHVGHLRIIERARERCDRLVVGVVTDEVAMQSKGRRPVEPLHDRMEIVAAIRHVDEVVDDHSTDKTLVWQRVRFDVLFKGDDWAGTEKAQRLELAMQSVGAKVLYLPYTDLVSSTQLIAVAADRHAATKEADTCR